MSEDTKAIPDSAPPRDDAGATDGRTEEQLLADIVSSSEFVPNEEQSLPVEQVPEVDPEESEQQDPKESDESANEEIEEGANEEEVESEGEDAGDEPATQDPELFTPEDLDLEAKVSLKIDGQDTEVSFNDLIKGYSTEQSLSKKGRELGDARKNFEEDYNKKLAEVQEMSTASVAVSSGSQMPLTPVMEPKPHSYTGYKQNSYCVNCGKYTFHWHGASPNDPDLYPNYECKDCGYVRKIKIS